MKSRSIYGLIFCAFVVGAWAAGPSEAPAPVAVVPGTELPSTETPIDYNLGTFKLLGYSNCIGVQLVAVPGTDKFLFMERPKEPHPYDRTGDPTNAGLMDYVTGKFENVYYSGKNFSMENCGHSFLKNGTVAILGGHKQQSRFVEGRKAIQTLDLATKRLQEAGTLQFGHWLVTATRLPNGMIAIISDSPSPVGPTSKSNVSNPFYELWDPDQPSKTKVIQLPRVFTDNTKYFYYPFSFVLPTGDLFLWSDVYGEIIKPYTGARVVKLPVWKGLVKNHHTAYPFSASSAMLPLSYKDNYSAFEVVIFGGQYGDHWINDTASDRALRLKVRITPEGGYEIGNWTMERMPSPRVSGSAVLLPNGMVVNINGAKRGQLGDAADGGRAMLNEPNFYPVLYDPKAPEGARFTQLARSYIPRLLHSTAGITLNGTIMLGGGDRSDNFWSPDAYDKSPHGFNEFRVELFNPPFVFDTANRPVIADGGYPTQLAQGEIFTVVYALPNATATVDGVVLLAPPSDTHGYNMHQRLVELEILASNTDTNHAAGEAGQRTVTVRGPPGPNVALPGPYMLFLLRGRTYGLGKWVTVV